MATEPKEERELRYEKLHRPAKEFKSRNDYLEHEIQITNLEDKRWGFYRPGKHFRFEIEDAVPAISGAIGKGVLVFGIIGAYAAALGLPPEFIVENSRLEIVWGGLLTIILMFLHPRLSAPGTHGWMIPLIPLVVLAGGHPLALGIVIGGLGLLLSFVRGGSLLQALTPPGVIGGLLVVFGVTGFMDQARALLAWTDEIGIEYLFLALTLVTMFIYAYLARIGARWTAIPLCTGVGAVIALVMGAPFEFRTVPGLPNLNPFYWWGADTGWMLGLPTLEEYIAVIPFALVAVVMWPADAVGLRAFQQAYYPPKTDTALIHIDDSFRGFGIRQITGSVLGGGQIVDPWGTYVIPAALSKRPLIAGQIALGIFCIVAALSGYLLDIFRFPPVLRLGLMVGVFIPLFEIGLRMITTTRAAYGAGLCIATGLLVNPVVGWAFAMLAENFGLLGPMEPEREKEVSKVLSRKAQLIITAVTFVLVMGIIGWVGLLPGVPDF